MPKLRVRAGPSPDDLVDISNTVNANTAYHVLSQSFDGHIAVNIKGFLDKDGKTKESGYFDREDRKGITWSIQVQGLFRHVEMLTRP